MKNFIYGVGATLCVMLFGKIMYENGRSDERKDNKDSKDEKPTEKTE